jgi:hypothetical protein
MKNIFVLVFFCTFISYSTVAQRPIILNTVTLNHVTVILPTLNNLKNLLNAPDTVFLSMMAANHYVQYKGGVGGGSLVFLANSPDNKYMVAKEPNHRVGIFLSTNSIYISLNNVQFKMDHPDAKPEHPEQGTDEYLFDFEGGRYHSKISFSLPVPENGSGHVFYTKLD